MPRYPKDHVEEAVKGPKSQGLAGWISRHFVRPSPPALEASPVPAVRLSNADLCGGRLPLYSPGRAGLGAVNLHPGHPHGIARALGQQYASAADTSAARSVLNLSVAKYTQVRFCAVIVVLSRCPVANIRPAAL